MTTNIDYDVSSNIVRFPNKNKILLMDSYSYFCI